MSSKPDVFARLDRIKELWRELERTRRTSPRYEELVGEIRAESLAYQALLIEQADLDRKQARIDVNSKDVDSKDVDSRIDLKQDAVNRKPVERRPIDRRKTIDRRKK